MGVITLTKLYDLLSDKVGKEAAENLTNFIEQKIIDEVENKSQLLSTREDLTREVSRLDLRIGETKVDLVKWMFAFWVTLALMIIGLYLKNQ
jgi:hypothetical protein